MVDLEFKEEDLERLVRGDWDLICVPRLRDEKNGQWLGKWVSVEKDGLYLSEGLEDDAVWKHSAGDKVLPLPKFTLTEFKAFCDWHPTFEWEAITSVFTNDDGTLDEVALAELDSRSRAAGALVRGVLVGPDDEYLKAWEAHCRIDDCKEEIDALRKLKPVTITERMFAKQELETLEARLAELLKPVTGPAEPVAQAEAIDFSVLADPGQLIEAFGKFTDMDASWFDNLKDTPRLLAARKVTGTGGRHYTPPLFCPFEVMLWLIDERRKKGKKVSPEKAWQLLQSNFEKVYNTRSAGDPR